MPRITHARVGGTYKMSFTDFTTGKSHSFGGRYVDLTPNECIRYTDKFGTPSWTITLLAKLVEAEIPEQP